MMGGLARWWEGVVAFWDEREAPYALGLVRICLGLCLVYDFGYIGVLEMVDALFGVAEVGGLSDALMRDEIPWYYDVVPATAETARLLWAVLLGSAITFTLGLYTRTSALVLLVAWTQFAHVLPYADRGIDTLCRMMLCLFLFAPSGAWASVDAWRRTGSVWGDGTPELAWARKLLIGQLVLMYFSAGILKTGFTWWPWGGSTALYFALQDPAVGAYDFTWLRDAGRAVLLRADGGVHDPAVPVDVPHGAPVDVVAAQSGARGRSGGVRQSIPARVPVGGDRGVVPRDPGHRDEPRDLPVGDAGVVPGVSASRRVEGPLGGGPQPRVRRVAGTRLSPVRGTLTPRQPHRMSWRLECDDGSGLGRCSVARGPKRSGSPGTACGPRTTGAVGSSPWARPRWRFRQGRCTVRTR